MPSRDRRIVFPMPVGGRLRTAASLLVLIVGLISLGAVSVVLGPPALFGAVLTLVVTLALLGLVGDEPGRRRDRASAPDRREVHTGSSDGPEQDDSVAILKRRYAAGDLGDEEFDRRVERLIALDGLDDAVDEREVERTRS